MARKKCKSKNKKAFTLIELLIVIAIIGILAALIIANLSAARARARDAQRKAQLQQIATALQLYFDVKNDYPASMSSSMNTLTTYFLCSDSGFSTSCTGTKYAEFTPPVGGSDQNYSYARTTTSAGAPDFKIYTKLETINKYFVCTSDGCKEQNNP
jgi:prepilin-type N-terminal cleavage/methylation domain-containing protein